MRLYIEDTDPEKDRFIDVRFSSVWKSYILAHLATLGVVFGIVFLISLIGVILGW